jgi:hypothetical protein
MQTLDIVGNQQWFFTNGATTASGCDSNYAASTTAGASPTSTVLSSASSSICWFTPTNPPTTVPGPWEVILDIDRVTNGTKALIPDGNGVVTDWSAGFGCTGATLYQCVDENPNDGDTSYIVSTSNVALDALFTLTDWTSAPVPPSPLSVLSVLVDASCRKTGAPSVDVRILVRSGGATFADATSQDCANSATYTTWTESWTTDPSDGLPWTLADLNALQVGVRDNDGFSREVRMSHLLVTVLWLPVYSVEIDKCTNAPCSAFIALYGPTNGNTYGDDVTFTTPSIPAQTFTGNDRLRFRVVLYTDGVPTTGSVVIRYNGPYPGTSDSRGTIAIPEFAELLAPALAPVVLVPLLRAAARRRSGR